MKTKMYYLGLMYGRSMVFIDDGSEDSFYCIRNAKVPKEIMSKHTAYMISSPCQIYLDSIDTDDMTAFEKVDASENGEKGARDLLLKMRDWRTSIHGSMEFDNGISYMVLAVRYIDKTKQ